MTLKAVLALIVTSVVAAPSARADEGMPPGGCPQGYVVFGNQGGDGGPPSYRPGDTVTASGVITNVDAGVSQVSLRWGAAEGPEVGSAAVDAHGSWTGISFQVPQEAAGGPQQVYYVALDRHGQMLPGLPYPFAIRVGEPVASPVPASAPAAAPTPATPKTDAPTRGVVRERASAPSVEASSPGAPASAADPAADRSRSVAPAGRQVTESIVRPAARLVAPRTPGPAAATPPARTRRTPSPQAAEPDVALPPYATRPPMATGPFPSTPAPARRPDAPRAGAAAGEATRAVRDQADAVLLAVMLAGTVVLGAALVRRRRTRVDDVGPAVAIVDEDAACPIEAELQDMIIAASRADAGGEEPEPAALR